jgi:GT2 family glycosyltransferase
MDLSIAIVNWNTRDMLRDCLASVYKNLDDLKAEVIVVDNGSRDGSPAMVHKEFPQVRLIESKDNLGFTKANNLAYWHSVGKYFLLLNSDTIVLPRALSRLVRFLDEHSGAGAAGCKLLNGDGSLQRSCSPFPTPATELFDALYLSKLFPKSRVFGSYAMSYWDFDSIREVDFAGGSCLMLRREALEQVGLLDEGFFMYSEEADLCFRLKKHHWKVYFVPDVSIVHFGGQSSKLDTKRTSVELYRSKYRFMKKHYGTVAAVSYKGVVALSSVLRMVALMPRVLRGENKSVDKERLVVQAKLFTWAVGRT